MHQDIKLTYLKKAKKFLDKNKNIITENEVDELVIKFIKKQFFNLDMNIDCRQMQGVLKNYYRIRKGNIRIIVQANNNEIIIEAIIENIGFRGDIYK
jgi:mRNA interferase RelE/StbE